MKSALVSCALLLLPSPAVAPASDALVFGVSKGTKLAKSFESSVTLEKKSASMSVSGRDLPKEILDEIEMEMSMAEVREFQDEYVEVDGARPTELVRTFHKSTDRNTKHFVIRGAEPQDEKEELESPIVGHAVAFTWNAKEKKYDPEFKGDKGKSEWLEKLKEDADFRRLLPDGKVDVGESWSIEPKEFNRLMSPGGDMPSEKEKEDDELDFDENLAGEAQAKFTGMREVDGEKLAVIALTAKLSTHHQTKGGEDLPPMKMEISFELEGELLWDVVHKHFRSYEVHGPVELTMTGEQNVEANGQKFEMKMRFELAGEMKAKGSVER